MCLFLFGVSDAVSILPCLHFRSGAPVMLTYFLLTFHQVRQDDNKILYSLPSTLLRGIPFHKVALLFSVLWMFSFHVHVKILTDTLAPHPPHLVAYTNHFLQSEDESSSIVGILFEHRKDEVLTTKQVKLYFASGKVYFTLRCVPTRLETSNMEVLFGLGKPSRRASTTHRCRSVPWAGITLRRLIIV